MPRRPAELDFEAPIHWVPREEYAAYFDSLSAEDRWTHSRHSDQATIWHWEERRCLELEEES
jgi:hypothetical protein